MPPIWQYSSRDGLMRAWLEILREQHPDVTWVSLEQEPYETESTSARSLSTEGEAAGDEPLAAVA